MENDVTKRTKSDQWIIRSLAVSEDLVFFSKAVNAQQAAELYREGDYEQAEQLELHFTEDLHSVCLPSSLQTEELLDTSSSEALPFPDLDANQ